LKSWLAAHGYALRSAATRLMRRPVTALFESAILGIALALPLGFMLAVENVRALAAHHPATPELSVYLALDASTSDVARISAELKKIAAADVRFVPKSEALERLHRSPAMAEVLQVLPANPLPDAFVVRLHAADAAALDAAKARIGSWPQVAQVHVDSGWAQKVDAVARTGRLAALALGLTLGLAMTAVVFNTVRLQMLQQREELELARLIGATNAFLRRPYLYIGVLQGLLGGAAAIAFLLLAYAGARTELDQLATNFGFPLLVQPVPLEVHVGVLVLGAGLGLAAAWLCAVRRLWARELRP
jgi:cell division transport system permease protein